MGFNQVFFDGAEIVYDSTFTLYNLASHLELIYRKDKTMLQESERLAANMLQPPAVLEASTDARVRALCQLIIDMESALESMGNYWRTQPEHKADPQLWFVDLDDNEPPKPQLPAKG